MKTTKKQFEIFKKNVEDYITQFELYDWAICVIHAEVEGIAQTNLDLKNKHAVVAFALDMPDWMEPSIKDSDYLDTVAKHEVSHILIGRLSCIAGTRCTTEEEITEATEELANKLTNLL